MSTDQQRTRWILAFDSSCGRCREISARVAQASDGKLEILPLAAPDVERWRVESLGRRPRWAPTLLKVTDGVGVRAWIGPHMAAPVVRVLGLRSSVDVLEVLGRLRVESMTHRKNRSVYRVLSQLPVPQLGVGVVLGGALVAAGLFSTGPDAARAWVQQNADQLPHTYSEVTAQPMQYRKAIYEQLDPATRSSLWSEQLTRYRAAHPDLSAEQTQLLDRATTVAADHSVFAAETSLSTEQINEFRTSAQQAFGDGEAAKVFATLGPSEEADHDTAQPASQRSCTCSATDDWCDNQTHCFRGGCIRGGHCGWFWGQVCGGLCKN